MNSNPIELFPDLVLELIFQHLNWQDIKTVSQMTTSWYETTGSSKKCMERITIDLNKYLPGIKRNDEVIHKSTRKYRHLLAACHDKRVASEEVFPLIKKFEQSAVSLTAFSLNISDDFTAEPLDMPNLRFLSVMDLSQKACELVFNECHELDKLQFRPISQPTFVLNLIKFLGSQSKLKTLVMMRDVNFAFFKDKVVNFTFELNRLVIERKSNSDFEDSEIKLRNFENFLTSQENSIEILEIDYVPSHSLIETIVNEMKVLKILKMKSRLRSEENLKLKKNESLVELDLNGFSTDKIKEILCATSKLETLKLPCVELTKSLLEFIVKTVKSLRKLFYDDIEGSCILCYNSLKASRNDINKELELVWLLS